MKFPNNTAVRDDPADSEAGNAVIEFLGLALVLMIPTVYFLLGIFAVQSGTLAASAAAQQAVQLIQAAEDGVSATHVQRVATLTAADYGVAGDHLHLTVDCPRGCDEGSPAEVRVSVDVQLPLIPWVRDSSFVTVSSHATAWGGKYS